MPRRRPDGTHYPSMMPKLCAECGKPGDAQNHVQAVAGVYAHKSCRVAWLRCTTRGCLEIAKSNGLCASHYNIRYYSERIDQMRARSVAWYQSNPDKVAARYAREKAAGRHREAARRWYWENRLAALARAHNQRAARLGNPGRVTAEQLQGRLSMFGGRCYMCNGDADGFDHVKPFAAGGANIAANMRPACVSCNSKKHKTWNGVAECLAV